MPVACGVETSSPWACVGMTTCPISPRRCTAINPAGLCGCEAHGWQLTLTVRYPMKVQSLSGFVIAVFVCGCSVSV